MEVNKAIETANNEFAGVDYHKKFHSPYLVRINELLDAPGEFFGLWKDRENFSISQSRPDYLLLKTEKGYLSPYGVVNVKKLQAVNPNMVLALFDESKLDKLGEIDIQNQKDVEMACTLIDKYPEAAKSDLFLNKLLKNTIVIMADAMSY